MTPAERRAALVKKVVDALAKTAMSDGTFKDAAEAALTVALEEAAQVAESIFQIHTDPDGTVHYSITPKLIAEDIRALMPE